MNDGNGLVGWLVALSSEDLHKGRVSDGGMLKRVQRSKVEPLEGSDR